MSVALVPPAGEPDPAARAEALQAPSSPRVIMVGGREIDISRPTLDVPDSCTLLGCSTWTGYQAIREGDFPAPVLHIGRAIRVPTRPLLELLGMPS
jgi:predicted DNA-binding transcriptional regulator AlpA